MDLVRPWMNIHSMIREDKIKNIDNIEVDNQYFIKDIKKGD